jgi:DNA-binding response OmpR family regulator
MRKNKNSTPVIMLTANAMWPIEFKGLDWARIDYLANRSSPKICLRGCEH